MFIFYSTDFNTDYCLLYILSLYELSRTTSESRKGIRDPILFAMELLDGDEILKRFRILGYGSLSGIYSYEAILSQ